MPTTPNPTTPTAPKKIARRQVKRVDGKLQVVFIDVATNQVISDLTGYTLADGSNNTTNIPTNTGTTPTGGDGGGGFAGNGNGGSGGDSLANLNSYLRAQNQAPGNAGPFLDFAKTVGGFIGNPIQRGYDALDAAGDIMRGGKDSVGKGTSFADVQAFKNGTKNPNLLVHEPGVTPPNGENLIGNLIDGFSNKPLASPAPLDLMGSTPQAAVKGSGAASAGTLSAASGGNVATNGMSQNGDFLTNDKGWVVATASDDLPPEQRALLDTLAVGDGKGSNYWESPSYNTIVGKAGKQFEDYSDHPGVVGMRTSAGPSTAAGRYQFTETTWNDVVSRYNNLHSNDPILDFSPKNQDRAALFLASVDYERRTGRDLFGDLANPSNQIGQYLKVGLGGQGNDTTWQILQKKSADEIAAAFQSNMVKNQQLAQQQSGAVPGSQNPANLLGTPLSKGALAAGAGMVGGVSANVSPNLQELMGKFNQVPGVTPSTVSLNPNAWNSGAKADPTAAALGALNADMVGRGLPPYSEKSNTQYVGLDGSVTIPPMTGSAVMGADRPASLPPAVTNTTFDNMFADAADRAQVNGFLETVNKSLGSPSWNKTYDGTLIAETEHPNRKSFLQDGADFTTAAGYGGITYPVWQSYAAQAGVTDFSLDSQKKVMWAVASDNYEKTTGRTLLNDITSGNKDAMYSALANSANIWQTLPGGASSAMSLIEAAGNIASSAQAALALNVATNGPYKDFGFGSDGNIQLSQPLNAFATSPSTVVNSSGQVMSKSAADAIREVSGGSSGIQSAAASTGAGFAAKAASAASSGSDQSSASSPSSTSGGAASAGSGFASSSASSSSGSSSDNQSSASDPSYNSSSGGAASSGSSGASSSAGHASSSGSSSAASSGSSAASSGASKASSSGSSASGSQSVTTSSGSTVTKDQRDAFGGY